MWTKLRNLVSSSPKKSSKSRGSNSSFTLEKSINDNNRAENRYDGNIDESPKKSGNISSDNNSTANSRNESSKRASVKASKKDKVQSNPERKKKTQSLSRSKKSTHKKQQNPQQLIDPITMLSDLTNSLVGREIGNYMNLKMVIDTKYAKNENIPAKDMDKIRQLISDITELYKKFSQKVENCVQIRMKDTGKSNEAISEAHGQPPASVGQKNTDNSSALNTDDLPPSEAIPSDLEILEQEAENAKLIHEKILANLKAIDAIGDDFACQIDPQMVIGDHSEVGQLERFFVRTKYKEMVKGCGPGRRINSANWAGSVEPGDNWMNDLIRAFLRHREIIPEPTKQGLSKEEQKKQSIIRGAESLAKKFDAAKYRSLNEMFLDVVDLNELISWMELSRMQPFLYSKLTLDIIENAVYKMGGWRHVKGFCLTWMLQFYAEFGRPSIAFPLPGCRLWLPETDSTQNLSITDISSSLTLDKISASNNEKNFGAKPDTGQKTPISIVDADNDPDDRFWNYIRFYASRELLNLHKMYYEEFGSSEENVYTWIKDVLESGVSSGKYIIDKDSSKQEPRMDKTLYPKRSDLLHPTLVNIREKAIVINAFFKPINYKQMQKLDQEIREIFSPQPGTPVQTKHVSHSKENDSDFLKSKTTNSLKERRTHKKSASTGIYQSLKSAKSDTNAKMEDGHGKPGLSKLTLTFGSLPRDASNYPQSPVPSMSRMKERTLSAPVPFDKSEEKPLDPSEIRSTWMEILSYPKLPTDKLIHEAFELSEKVVKFYLIYELPAKYQSMY